MLLATIVAVSLVGSVVVPFLRRSTGRSIVPAIGVGIVVGLDVGLVLVAVHALGYGTTRPPDSGGVLIALTVGAGILAAIAADVRYSRQPR
jgi:hypothetical protein